LLNIIEVDMLMFNVLLQKRNSTLTV